MVRLNLRAWYSKGVKIVWLLWNVFWIFFCGKMLRMINVRSASSPTDMSHATTFLSWIRFNLMIDYLHYQILRSGYRTSWLTGISCMSDPDLWAMPIYDRVHPADMVGRKCFYRCWGNHFPGQLTFKMWTPLVEICFTNENDHRLSSCEGR